MSKLISMYETLDKTELSYSGGPEKTLSFDVAVVGGGGSGVAAAVRAAQKGAKVVLIEKMEKLGGNSYFAGGLLSTTSKYQKKLGMPDKTEHYIKTNFQKHGYTLNPGLIRRFIGNTGTFYEWIADLGFDTENTRYVMDAVVMIKDRKDPGILNHPAYGPGSIGSTFVDLMASKLTELGVTVLTSTKVLELLMDDGNITGVLARGMDADYRISAKAVVLSTGGFGGNVEMLRKYLPQYFSSDHYFSHYCLLSTTGDGITMAEKVGAEIGENISVGVEAMCHIPGSYSIQCLCKSPKTIIVNGNGTRFIAEDDTGKGTFAMDQQPEGIAYYLFTEEKLKDTFADGLKKINFGDREPSWEELLGDIQKEIGEGKILCGESLSELAAQIGCSAETLANTVNVYGAYIEKGHDDELLKDPEHLVSLGGGKWYAAKLYRKFDVTMGGVSINENLQVIRPDQTVIPGLYATGDTASGWMGKDYGPLFSSFAWAMNSGYMAGEEAAAFAK